MRYMLIICLSIFANACFSQAPLSTKKKKAIELYIEADKYRVRGQFQQAEHLLLEALSKDEDFHEAWFRLGQTYLMARNNDRALKAFLRALERNPQNKPLSGVYFELGSLYLKLGDYNNAEMYLSQYLNSRPGNRGKIDEAQKLLASARYAIDNKDAIAAVKLTPMPEIINAFPMQYFPVLTADKNILIYTRRLSLNEFAPNHDEDLVISRRKENGEWGRPESISENINSQLNEGTCTISADGRMLIFTSCLGRETQGSCDLFVSYKEGNNWSVPDNMGKTVNSSSWDSQPALSADGRTLFFVSYRAGGYGQEDIWYSKLNEKGEWSPPLNAGPKINTEDSEVSPFLHANGQTLFFSSSGHKGFGGYDVFKSEWAGGQNFTDPENIGAPINTSADQISVFITADGEDGYYSHETFDTNSRRSIIYTFDVPESMRPGVIANYVTGLIKDKDSGEKLPATVELYDINKNELINLIHSDSVTGKYLMVLPSGSQYALYVNKEGYLFQNKSFDYKEQHAQEPIHIDFELQPINKGASVVLNNIFFDFDSYEIRKESLTELQRVLKFLKDNPRIKIEISGHTDNRGTDDYNHTLSEQRAKSVYDYLTKNDIPDTRIKFKGYGADKPVAPNDTDQNRQMNRRIEFLIL